MARRSLGVEHVGEERIELGAGVVARREGGEHAVELGGLFPALHGRGESRHLQVQRGVRDPGLAHPAPPHVLSLPPRARRDLTAPWLTTRRYEVGRACGAAADLLMDGAAARERELHSGGLQQALGVGVERAARCEQRSRADVHSLAPRVSCLSQVAEPHLGEGEGEGEGDRARGRARARARARGEG